MLVFTPASRTIFAHILHQHQYLFPSSPTYFYHQDIIWNFRVESHGFTESIYQPLKVNVNHAQLVVLVSVLKTIPMLKQNVFVKMDILARFVITSQLHVLILILVIWSPMKFLTTKAVFLRSCFLQLAPFNVIVHRCLPHILRGNGSPWIPDTYVIDVY